MNLFDVLFIGLICHVGASPTNKDFAALVEDADRHIAVVLFEDRLVAVDDASSIEFSFNGRVDKSHAVTDALFNTYVPSIQQIMGGTIHSDRVLSEIAIKVYYPASHNAGGNAKPSTLTVCELYHCFGRHRVGGKVERGPARVARVVKLRVVNPAQLSVWQVKDNQRTLVGSVGPDEDIVIENVSKSDLDLLKQFYTQRNAGSMQRSGKTLADQEECGTSDTGHFRIYGALLNGENDAVQVDSIPNAAPADTNLCLTGWPQELMNYLSRGRAFVSTQVECGNTDYP